ncbi:hypothetical protein HYFRA_00006640 [Hymenoscyphus fraxineus]|uniref:Uncharacterized protein n=1 Tax=Hymenoscyphus fraxineus TaxID=746836 RepID=A0A9N9PS33_9HELO|nr:hypothetical protein HYFRA_00006640 [Hymenoscyphus fraxineus]
MQSILPFTLAIFALTHTTIATPTSQLQRRGDIPVYCKHGVFQNEDYDIKNVLCERSGCDGGTVATSVRLEDNSVYWKATCTQCPSKLILVNNCYEGTLTEPRKPESSGSTAANASSTLTKTGDPEVNPPPTPNTLGTSPTTPETNDPEYTHDNENGTHTSDTNTTTTPKTDDPQSTGDNGNGTNSTVPVVATTNNAAPTSGSLSLVALTVAMFTVLMV